MSDGEATSEGAAQTAAESLCARVARVDAGTWSEFLMSRRWYGAKGSVPSAVGLDGFLPLPWLGGCSGIARLWVEDRDGRRLHYQLPLAERRASDLSARPPAAVVQRVDAQSGDRVLFDATEDPEFRRELGQAFQSGARFEHAAWSWAIEPLATALSLPDASRVGTAEQSNTSILYGDSAILKLFRRIEPGVNPDVEMGRFLTSRASFPHTPALLGTIHFRGGRETAVAGMLQRLVPDCTDAWSHVLARGRAFFTAAPEAQPISDVSADAEQLGRITRELHEALSSAHAEADPAFGPEPGTRADVEAWIQGARRMIEEGDALLEQRLRENALSEEARRAAGDRAERRAQYEQRLDRVKRSIGDDAGLKIRHHGDYHLGQVLRSATGAFLIIDFEGEPARPLEERRRKHCPLRDVAGMLRSFAYAAATLAPEERTQPASRSGSHAVASRAAIWERSARDAFLDGYLGADTPARFLPKSAAATRGLIALFEIEKVFYELLYELNNRPDWVWIPLRGIANLTARDREGRSLTPSP